MITAYVMYIKMKGCKTEVACAIENTRYKAAKRGKLYVETYGSNYTYKVRKKTIGAK